MNLDRRLFKEISLVKGLLILSVGLAFMAGVAVVLQARQVSHIITEVFLRGQAFAQVLPWMAGLLVVVVSRAALSYFGEWTAVIAAQRVKEHLRNRLARHLMDLGPAFTQGERSGELIATATQGIEALDAYFSQFLPQLALAGLLPLAFLMVAFPLDPLSGAVLLVTGPLIPVFMFLIGSNAEALTRRQWKALGRMSAYFLDTLQGLTTLKALGRSREQTGRIAQVSEQYRAATMSVLRVTFLSALALELLGTIGTAIIAVEVGLRLLYGRMGFESAFFLLLLAPEFYQPLRALGLRFHASMSGAEAARRIFAVLELPAVENPPAPRKAALDQAFTIALEAVHYTYPGRDQPALDGISFQIQSGQMTALVGASGAGKSTIAALLLRFLRPESGVVRWNGIPLEEIDPQDWRTQVAWLPQQPYIFQGSLADNLRIAMNEATMAEMRQAANQAGLLDWIDQQPEGLDTRVGEGGARLSGGQIQRLALARAFLRNAPLLILDEPTAHLDVAQERALEETTRRLCVGRTVLVIAHRLPTVVNADQIVVLADGAVVEQGTPTALLAQNGAYARLAAAYQGGAA
ncbi:MAG TPA: thiol reductant ABC exporter subunit CydD [Anaerolineaceae bacterium]